jgi:hypothetical protein
MFGLPLTGFVPNDDFVDPNIATNRHRLLHEHLRLRTEKLQVLRELELLIIDEISMVRCDTFDAIDLVLRTVRGNRRPFGDVQVLLIGDVHQLPPVAKDLEWSLLKSYYRSPYFFDSLVWPQLDAAQIELQTIYRQSDQRFLSLLNNVRNRTLSTEDYSRLRERYNPTFKPTEPGYVQLSTHNRTADSVNSSELASLSGKTHTFAARIEGEFPEHLFPCDEVLSLKIGAQVMFIRNDTEASAYYNGKLAIVKRIQGTDITVTFRDSGHDYTLHPETWENIGYGVEEGKVVQRELGTFSQYPLRLAWAITIHKSQGLTFDKVIIDAGRSFAAGQVYVALSRCRSLEGIVLHSLITPNALHDDLRVAEFDASRPSAGELQDVLTREKARYANHLLLRLFTFAEWSAHLEDWRKLIGEKNIPDKEAAIALQERIHAQTSELNATADKFQRQLHRLTEAAESDPNSATILRERCQKAIAYFTEQLATQLVAPLREHIQTLAYKKKMKRYVKHVQLIEESCWRKINQLYDAKFLDDKLYNGAVLHTREKLTQVVTSITSGSKVKRSTFR